MLESEPDPRVIRQLHAWSLEQDGDGAVLLRLEYAIDEDTNATLTLSLPLEAARSLGRELVRK